jgi:RHH-type proline utilization regulon transcriptional repressor/proline dehydrogenase/delta 1-pyrroline-5-carboxylate dehydrogenase
LGELRSNLAAALAEPTTAGPIVGGKEIAGREERVFDPGDRRRQIGTVVSADAAMLERALAAAAKAAPGWDRTPAVERAAILERAAELYERDRAALMALVIREGGRTIPAALSELREAADYLRYYAARARADFAEPLPLPGPTGERNRIALHGRGVFACVSPWNFPLAIFTGQIAAALAAGNAVIAKPAEQTPLTAAAAVRRLHDAGIPGDILHLLPGSGEAIGAALVADRRIAGVAFTGSTDTARAINLALAKRPGPIVPLIAETGGQNAMIVDSSALPEQVVADVLTSAFDSAGQRCSALRLLYAQDDIAWRIVPLLAGAMAELTIGDPALLATDVGPVIDAEARAALEAHAERMSRDGRLRYQCALPPGTEHGTFFAPRAFEIDSARRLTGEVFGPILHVVRWQSDRLDQVIDEIAATGFALTLGIHSRIDETQHYILDRLGVGNSYVTRNMIGAVVGVQPFGGERLSGTGPKAGGPRYLYRFATERTVSTDTTAAGGNATLLSLADER